LRPPVERVRALTGFGLDKLGDDGEAFSFRKPGNGCALRFDSETRALLLLCGDTVVGNSGFHTNCIPPFALCMNPLSEQCCCCFPCCTATSKHREALRSGAKNAHNRIVAGGGAFVQLSTVRGAARAD
jgi:hypothetical protein